MYTDMLSHKTGLRSTEDHMDALPPQGPTQGSSREAIGYLKNVDDFEFVDKLGEGFFGYDASYTKSTLIVVYHF